MITSPLRRTATDRGVIDLPSMMVGVVIMAIVVGGVTIGLYGLIPWTNDQSTIQKLNAYRNAQSVAYIQRGSYLDTDGLISGGYLPPDSPAATVGARTLMNVAPRHEITTELGSARECYAAVTTTSGGTVFYTDSSRHGAARFDGQSASCDGVSLLALAGHAPPVVFSDGLASAVVGDDYAEAIRVSGALSPLLVSAGALPAGLALSGGAVVGVPSEAGEFTFSLAAQNQAGTTEHEFTMVVAEADDGTGMVSTWDTSLIDDTEIILPLHGEVDATVDWGDGHAQQVTGEARHTYDEDGAYEVSVSGTFTGWGGDRKWTPEALTGVSRWSGTGTVDISYGFDSASSLMSVVEVPDSVRDASYLFYDAIGFNGDISGWDVSGVENMSNMFYHAKAFDQDISGWETTSATNMSYMFYLAAAFNQDLSGWDVSNVTEHYFFELQSGLDEANLPAF